MELTTEQLEMLDQRQPVTLVVGGRECVLMRKDAYQQQQGVLVDEWHPSTLGRQMAQMMADDWNDPAMSVYDDK